jgi:hypothetical protein
LVKCLWLYADERETLWILVVEFKYGNSWGEWCSNVVNGVVWGWSIEKY